jgi:hypothetical protein
MSDFNGTAQIENKMRALKLSGMIETLESP